MAVILHHSDTVTGGHYTIVCRVNGMEQRGLYRWYDDARVSHAVDFDGLLRPEYYGTTLYEGVYMLLYARVSYWSDTIGDGTESTPYHRDVHVTTAAKQFFRGVRVSAAV